MNQSSTVEELFNTMMLNIGGLSKNCEDINKFLKSWMKIEEESAKALSKLVDATAAEFAKPCRRTLDDDMGRAWEMVLKLVRTWSSSRKAFSTTISNINESKVTVVFKGDHEKAVRASVKDAKAALVNTEIPDREAEKSAKRYSEAGRELEAALIGYSTGSPSRTEKDIELAQRAFSSARDTYASALVKANACTEVAHCHRMPAAIRDQRQFAVHSIDKIKSAFVALGAATDPIASALASVHQSIGSITSFIDPHLYAEKYVMDGVTLENTTSPALLEFREYHISETAMDILSKIEFTSSGTGRRSFNEIKRHTRSSSNLQDIPTTSTSSSSSSNHQSSRRPPPPPPSRASTDINLTTSMEADDSISKLSRTSSSISIDSRTSRSSDDNKSLPLRQTNPPSRPSRPPAPKRQSTFVSRSSPNASQRAPAPSRPPVPSPRVNSSRKYISAASSILTPSCDGPFGDVDWTLLSGIVTSCMAYLETPRRLKEEGLFRIPGSQRECKELLAAFEKTGVCDLSEICDPITVACLLKLWWRESSTPVFPPKGVLELSNSAKDTDSQSRLIAMKHVVNTEFPSSSLQLLKALIRLFAAIASYESENKMNAGNIATSCVSLFANVIDNNSSENCIRQLIMTHTEIFSPKCPKVNNYEQDQENRHECSEDDLKAALEALDNLH